MDLPIKFPSETEVLLEEVARFRALTPREQFQSLRALLNAGALILRASPNAAWARKHAEEQEALAQRNIREFIARHHGEVESSAGPSGPILPGRALPR